MTDPAQGRFITLEGGEGAGKSTQCTRLAKALEEAGHTVVTTREPGGAPGAEAIRDLLVTGEVDRWDGVTELLLHYAARRNHVERTIRPALTAGKWVISDRFADSTMAYQGYGHELGRDRVERLHKVVLGDFQPDLTLILDLPVEAGLARAQARDGEAGDSNRYERMDEAFHRRLRDGFLDIAKREPKRCVVIDAAADPDTVQDRIRAAAAKHLGVAFAGETG